MGNLSQRGDRCQQRGCLGQDFLLKTSCIFPSQLVMGVSFLFPSVLLHSFFHLSQRVAVISEVNPCHLLQTLWTKLCVGPAVSTSSTQQPGWDCEQLNASQQVSTNGKWWPTSWGTLCLLILAFLPRDHTGGRLQKWCRVGQPGEKVHVLFGGLQREIHPVTVLLEHPQRTKWRSSEWQKAILYSKWVKELTM